MRGLAQPRRVDRCDRLVWLVAYVRRGSGRAFGDRPRLLVPAFAELLSRLVTSSPASRTLRRTPPSWMSAAEPGRVTEALLELVPRGRVLAFDASPEMVTLARRRRLDRGAALGRRPRPPLGAPAQGSLYREVDCIEMPLTLRVLVSHTNSSAPLSVGAILTLLSPRLPRRSRRPV
jgi:hypothetical protein